MIIKGYRGEISETMAKELASQGVFVFNARCVGGKEHLEFSYIKAKEAFKSGNNIAKNFHLEIMLVLSGRRQIKDALSLCGINNVDKIAAISEMDFVLPLKRDDSILNCTEDKLKFLKIDRYGDSCGLFFENSALLHLER